MNDQKHEQIAGGRQYQAVCLQDCHNKKEFMSWLRTGLESYLLHDKGIKAFPGAVADIGQYDYLEEGLETAFHKLPPLEQAYFRQAVADLINTWEVNNINLPVLEHLLCLAATLPTKEVLYGLPAWLRFGYLDLLPDKVADDLFGQIFLTVARLAGPTRESVKCVRGMIALPGFNSDWAGMALEILWLCDEKNIASHFERLRPYLIDLMQGEPSRPQRWTKRLLDVVGLDVIMQALPALKYSDDDSWLITGLLAGKDSPVQCWIDSETEKLCFRLRNQPETTAQLAIEQENFDLFRHLRNACLIKLPEPFVITEEVQSENDESLQFVKEFIDPCTVPMAA